MSFVSDPLCSPRRNRGEHTEFEGKQNSLFPEGPIIKVTVALQSAFRKMLCLRAALTETMANYVSLES